MIYKEFVNYQVLRFDLYLAKSKFPKTSKVMKIFNKNIDEYIAFQKDIVNKFCSKNIQELTEQYEMRPFGKGETYFDNVHLFHAPEIGIHMLKKEYGLRVELHWNYTYWVIPRQTELFDFINERIKTLSIGIEEKQKI